MLTQNLTKQQLAALNRLRAVEFKPLLDLLAAERDSRINFLLKADDQVTIHRLQGYIHALRDMADAINESHERL